MSLLPRELSDETRDLIDSFLRAKGKTVFQPFNAAGTETTRHTKELIAKRRRDFRKSHKA